VFGETGEGRTRGACCVSLQVVAAPLPPPLRDTCREKLSMFSSLVPCLFMRRSTLSCKEHVHRGCAHRQRAAQSAHTFGIWDRDIAFFQACFRPEEGLNRSQAQGLFDEDLASGNYDGVNYSRLTLSDYIYIVSRTEHLTPRPPLMRCILYAD
jgi:hypothetical protein